MRRSLLLIVALIFITGIQPMTASGSGNLTCQGNACAAIETGAGNTGPPYNLPYTSFKNVGSRPVNLGVKSPFCYSELKTHRLNPNESYNQSGGVCNAYSANY